MNLTRRQELALIQIGIESVVENYLSRGISEAKTSKPRKIGTKPKKRKWSKEQHKKFASSMKKIWQERRKNNEG